jgi:hypothetical protein
MCGKDKLSASEARQPRGMEKMEERPYFSRIRLMSLSLRRQEVMFSFDPLTSARMEEMRSA